MLNHFGYDTQAVGSAVEALKALESDRFDLVTTDYSMKVVKGDELARRIKERWPDLPILMISAYADTLEVSCYAHVNAVLAKPFMAKELKDAVARLLAQ